MVPDSSSSNETQKDEPDILDLKANAAEHTADADANTPFQADAVAAADATASAEADTVAQADRSPWSAGPTYSSSASSAASSAEQPPAAPVHSSTPALIGAGILGGLIAIAASASMQYAGYWPAGSASSSETSEVTALRSEVDGLKQQLSTIPTDLKPSGALEQRLAALEAKADNGAVPNPETAGQIKALQDTIVQLQAAARATDAQTGEQITDLGNRLATAEKTLKDQPGEAAVSKAIAATYLKAAVDRGDPFLTELQTFASLSPDDPAVAALKPLAATGVKSKAAIAKDFDTAAKAISEALDQTVQGESMTDRLFASARSLISIRPVGNVTGTDWGAILARMEDKLTNGDIKGASLEWDGLPDPAKAASKDFKAELDSRAKADDLTRGLAERTATPAVNAG